MSNHLYNFDSQYDNAIIGIDEAGRGCLAGDVFAAAGILDNSFQISGLDDSKKLSPISRAKICDEIVAGCKAYAVATATVQEVEEINILQAALLAMKRAYQKLSVCAGIIGMEHIVLIDGNKAPAIDNACVHCVIGGDAKSASIAAASILAKVARDNYMLELDKKYPEYQFAKHKGYATKLHREMILTHGVSPVHRESFLKKIMQS